MNLFSILGIVFLIQKKNFRQALVVYCVSCFIMPVFVIKGLRVNYELIGFLVILYLYLLANDFKLIVIYKGRQWFYYLAVYVVLNVYHFLFNQVPFPVITLYAVIRYCILIIIIQDVFGKDIIYYTDKILTWVLAVNFGTAIIQMVVPKSVSFFYPLYYKSTLTPLLQRYQAGYFDRAYGTTGSPVILGVLSALIFTFYFCLAFKNKKNKGIYVKLLMSATTGILAMSKSAIIAIPIISIITIMLYTFMYGATYIKKVIKLILVAFLAGILLIFLKSWMSGNGFPIEYYLSFIKNPIRALATRYSAQNGNLVEAIKNITQHPFIGPGKVTSGVFVGDSLFVVILYETGICGLFAYAIPYISSFFMAVRKRAVLNIALIVAIWMLGVGSALHVSFYTCIFAAVLSSFAKGNSRI